MWYAHDGMGWWMVFGGILWLLFWGSIVWLIVTTVRPGRRTSERQEYDALEIARRRYAAGEISREEFERIRDDLTARTDAPH